eukprot:183181_1
MIYNIFNGRTFDINCNNMCYKFCWHDILCCYGKSIIWKKYFLKNESDLISSQNKNRKHIKTKIHKNISSKNKNTKFHGIPQNEYINENENNNIQIEIQNNNNNNNNSDDSRVKTHNSFSGIVGDKINDESQSYDSSNSNDEQKQNNNNNNKHNSNNSLSFSSIPDSF